MTSRHPTAARAVLDVGGTSIKLGGVSGDAVVVGEPVPTLGSAERDVVLGQLAVAVDAALASAASFGGPVAGVAVAVPGPFDLAGATPLLRGLGKLDSIYGVDLRAELGRRSRVADVPVVFVRDSDAVGVGEAVFGAGRSARRVLTVALGTGCGTCLTQDGVPVDEVDGQVIERLHERRTPDGTVDEVLSARGLAGLLGIEPALIPSVLAARPLRERVQWAVDEFGGRLGRFIAGAHDLGFDRVVVAGGLARSFALFARSLAEVAPVRCAAAELGTRGALLGAVRLAFPDGSDASGRIAR